VTIVREGNLLSEVSPVMRFGDETSLSDFDLTSHKRQCQFVDNDVDDLGLLAAHPTAALSRR
jgi:hypothetical protein